MSRECTIATIAADLLIHSTKTREEAVQAAADIYELSLSARATRHGGSRWLGGPEGKRMTMEQWHCTNCGGRELAWDEPPNNNVIREAEARTNVKH